MTTVSRQFRLHPPTPSRDFVARHRLVETLAQRFSHRLVTIVAGPGFGKTTLLVAAMNENALRSRGRDVWLSCERADASSDHLTAGLVSTVGDGTVKGIEGVVEWVWSHAPEPVALILDDIHEIDSTSPGARLLQRLLDDLPSNGHVVLASREPVPVATARLAAAGDLLRVREPDLVFDAQELEHFARTRGIEISLLAPSGGWPALVNLTATAGADLTIEYLWEEVLTRLGPERAKALARLAVAGGGDDEVVAAQAGIHRRIDDVVGGVPLVDRRQDGFASLHPLWHDALRHLLTEEEATGARTAAAAVHRRNGRIGAAVDLLIEAQAWNDVLEVVAASEMSPHVRVPPSELVRWCALLPAPWRDRPEAQLARGLEVQQHAPFEALEAYQRAAAGFREIGDIEGEVAAVGHEGLVRWWANDFPGLFEVHQRLGILAGLGSTRAKQLQAVGIASIAHIGGQSDRVLRVLQGVDDDLGQGWTAVVCWLRSVAHRRDGDLPRARQELDRAEQVDRGVDPQRDIARLRVDWLDGQVDQVLAGFATHVAEYERAGDRFLARETGLERAGKAAWLGDVDGAAAAIEHALCLVPEVPNPLARILEAIARAAVAIGRGDEAAAAAYLGAFAAASVGGAEGWYWRDRTAVALVHVLVPEVRSMLETTVVVPAHRHGLPLAEALEAARAGDLDVVRRLAWPEPGIVRAHLPLRWVAELAAAGVAADNPAPNELLVSVGDLLRPALRSVAASDTAWAPVAAAAKRMAAHLPAVPSYRVRLCVLGPLQLYRDGVLDEPPELRRQRVRELLCLLVARRHIRRETASEELWPDLDDRGRNLRVTLSYAQRAMQPDRVEDEPPYFLRSDGATITLAGHERLEVDAWELDALLDEADAAERATTPSRALEAYRRALPLWRGEPFVEAPFSSWAEMERTRLRTRFGAAAVRAAELMLAARLPDEARAAAERALDADPTAEGAYRLLAKAHLAVGEPGAARRALDRCRTILATYDIQLDVSTISLLRSIGPTDGIVRHEPSTP